VIQWKGPTKFEKVIEKLLCNIIYHLFLYSFIHRRRLCPCKGERTGGKSNVFLFLKHNPTRNEKHIYIQCISPKVPYTTVSRTEENVVNSTSGYNSVACTSSGPSSKRLSPFTKVENAKAGIITSGNGSSAKFTTM
jgi:hypothetical protein